MSADEDDPRGPTGPEAAEDAGPVGPTLESESLLLTYAAPFLGVLLIAVGLPLSIVGGYVVVQDRVGLCGEPSITATPVDQYDRFPETVEELPAEDLTAAERRALEEAIESPLREGTIEGDVANRDALLDGVVIAFEGESYYVQITSQNSCLEVEPLLFPIGGVAIIVGIVGVLTPPIYRKLAGFEERIRGERPE
ncbi:hypothetical protein [Natrinema caseinilyticum]|uniref:hypothetical protein n=1 Tax=Natrinema caseinilyticum TaxID=2961570 RepID=UPI0020C52941|nr:hypothetical protein [Natrinema caseinilyticum]